LLASACFPRSWGREESWRIDGVMGSRAELPDEAAAEGVPVPRDDGPEQRVAAGSLREQVHPSQAPRSRTGARAGKAAPRGRSSKSSGLEVKKDIGFGFSGL
jgi:hypothetical protein